MTDFPILPATYRVLPRYLKPSEGRKILLDTPRCGIHTYLQHLHPRYVVVVPNVVNT